MDFLDGVVGKGKVPDAGHSKSVLIYRIERQLDSATLVVNAVVRRR